MAETLSKGISVHFVLFFRFFLRIKFLPECYCALGEHATPVTFHHFFHILKPAHCTHGLKLIKFEVWRCDLWNFVIFNHIFHKKFFSRIIRKSKENGKNIGMTCHIVFAG